MPFPTDAIAVALTPRQTGQLVKLLTVHYAYPLPYPLAGAYFEELFASVVGGEREKRKLLFDVLQGPVGWSLKTLLWSRLTGDFELVLQRCDILRDKKLSLSSPIETLGRSILERFNTFCEKSSADQGVSDPRAAFLIRDVAEKNFVFFQQRYRLYTDAEVEWQWGTDDRKSLKGFVDGRLVLRWYRSGTQLFGVYSVPEDAHRFHVDCDRADLDATIDFFTRAGLVHPS